MSKFDEKVDLFYNNLTKDLKVKGVDKDLLTKVAKGLGPSIYTADGSLVSSSDKDELERLKKNFLIKKLGCNDGPELDKAIASVVDTMGSSNRNKYRGVFYYLLVKELGKESAY